MATIETRSKKQRHAESIIPPTITPERQPITWKPWPDSARNEPRLDGLSFPPCGNFFHIVNPPNNDSKR